MTLSACELPEDGWGWLTIADASTTAGRAYTDNGLTHEHRGLKGRTRGRPGTRARKPSRRIPAPPELVAMLPDLVSIERSGHIPATALDQRAHQGSQPLFRFSDGSIVPLGRPGPQWDGPSSLQAAWLAAGGFDAERTLYFHAAEENEAERFRSYLGGQAPIVEFSPAMTVHTGIGCVGVAWLRRD